MQSPSTLCSLLQMIFYLDSNNFRSFFIFTLILDSFVILRTKLQFDEIFIFDLRSNLHWINKILKVLLSARTTRRVETFELGMVINHIELDRRQSYLITHGGWFRLTLYGEWVKREDTQKLRLLFPLRTHFSHHSSLLWLNFMSFWESQNMPQINFSPY